MAQLQSTSPSWVFKQAAATTNNLPSSSFEQQYPCLIACPLLLEVLQTTLQTPAILRSTIANISSCCPAPVRCSAHCKPVMLLSTSVFATLATSTPAAVYTNNMPRNAASIVTKPPAAVALDAPLVRFLVIGVRIGRASPESLKTGSGAGGGGAGGWNFMFCLQPQAPKKMPFATTSPHTSASTTSRVWLALSATLRFSGDSQCTC